VLQFCTGSDTEPPLEYMIQPDLEFVERDFYLPTGNTFINRMQLTIPTDDEQPSDRVLFNFFDFAFCNSYFNLQ
jgi:hypothetical protein